MSGFPFSAIVGSDDYKTALLANAVDPGIGGVLAIGERGTAKSTVARAVATLLPDRPVATGCAYGCHPEHPFARCPDGPHVDGMRHEEPARLVELPVGSTLDRLVGGFDVAQALGGGEMRFQPGLLAAANRNILYVDEVNLLADHLVDAMLDSAASGVNNVERDGMAVTHAARFVLVGTMNPEEGDLRPQFLDRFGLMVNVTASRDASQRAEIVRRRLAFERDREGFAASWLAHDAKLRTRVTEARDSLPELALSDAQLTFVSETCARLGAQGMRADIVASRTACALAALAGRTVVDESDLRSALMLALPHRVADPMRESAHEAITRVAAALSETVAAVGAGGHATHGHTRFKPTEEPLTIESLGASSPRTAAARSDASPGARPARSERGHNGAIDSQQLRENEAPDLPATVRAHARSGSNTGAVDAADLRSAVASGPETALVVVAVDTSGSLFADLGQAGVERCLSELFSESIARRDRIALVAFGGHGARLLSPPTRNRQSVMQLLSGVERGGTTPLAGALDEVNELIRRERQRDEHLHVATILFTDGRANESVDGGDALTEAHERAARLARLTTECCVIARRDWHSERLATRANARLVEPRWLVTGDLRAAANA